MDDVISEFLVESYDNLDQLDRDLLELEHHPDSQQTLASVFRTIHTIKGTCGFLDFHRLEAVAHVGENLLSKLRDGELVMTPLITSALLSFTDAVREMLTSIETTGGEGERDDTGLVALLTSLAQSTPATDAVDEHATTIDTAAIPEVAEAPAPAPAPAPAVPTASTTPKATAPTAPTAAAPPAAEDGAEARTSLAETTIRVGVGLLDDLMNLVGELVLARNQIVQLTNGVEESEFFGPAQRLNLITTELQERVMRTRMQPIGNVWSKFPRVVRDLALACGVQVELEMEGEDTELDKTLIESVKDPLTHLVRNAVDHGIEPPELRIARGKAPGGRLRLRAFHQGGQVNIEISDDGGGINLDKVRAKAVERGLITNETAARMPDREVAGLIFLPGFSTAEKVTNVSGRGVGMDVVKTNIEKIGGSVDVTSVPGQGTTFLVRIPLTLAIIPALIVISDGNRYAIPQVSLRELVRLDGENARRAMENIHGAPVYRLRGNLLTLVDLRKELGGTSRLKEAATEEDPVINIVVLHTESGPFGLVVESISDAAEIVVKPLSPYLKSIPVFAGATIMGDGNVGLILDVTGLAQRASVMSAHGERTLADRGSTEIDSSDCHTLLLFRSPDDGRMAIPLSAVDRLEKFPRDAVEYAGAVDVTQYRGEILPLVHVSSELPERRIVPRNAAPPTDDELYEISTDIQVIVHETADRRVGLVVDQILDIVDVRGTFQPATREGVLGTIVVQERVTEVIDPAQLLDLAHARRISIPAGVLS